METKVQMNSTEIAIPNIEAGTVTQEVTPASTISPAQEEIEAVDQKQNVTLRTKSRRLTSAEKKDLIETIKIELLEGHPLQAIALKYCLTMTLLLKLFADLMLSDFRKEITTPSYDVVAAGTPVSKLPFKMLEGVKYIRVEHHEDGLLIKPYQLEN